MDVEFVETSVKLRGRLISALSNGFPGSFADRASALQVLAKDYGELGAHLEGLPEELSVKWLKEALGICCNLCLWMAGIVDAKALSGNYLVAAKARALLLVEEVMQQAAQQPAVSEFIVSWLASVVEIAETDIRLARNSLASLSVVPLPAFYSRAHDSYASIKAMRKEAGLDSKTEQPKPESVPLVVKVITSLDGQFIDREAAIRSGIQYDLMVVAVSNYWPDDARQLEIDYVSTMDTRDWSITPLVFPAPEAGNIEVQATGHLIIRTSQSFLSQPASFRLRARFLSADGSVSRPAKVIGSYELVFRAFSENSYPVLTQYGVVDLQVIKVLEQARAELPDFPVTMLDDFQRCLVFVASYASMVSQTGVFKAGEFANRRIDERRDFQQHMLQSARMILGPDVREAETQSGGNLDLRFRDVVIELKVDYEVKDRSLLRAKYIGQPTQYSATTVPLSITCILDMTEKDSPPAHVANNISLETPQIHGFKEGADLPYPSKVAVVIIDGNRKLPSSYSK